VLSGQGGEYLFSDSVPGGQGYGQGLSDQSERLPRSSAQQGHDQSSQSRTTVGRGAHGASPAQATEGEGISPGQDHLLQTTFSRESQGIDEESSQGSFAEDSQGSQATFDDASEESEGDYQDVGPGYPHTPTNLLHAA
jgi:hypothetical protein